MEYTGVCAVGAGNCGGNCCYGVRDSGLLKIGAERFSCTGKTRSATRQLACCVLATEPPFKRRQITSE